MHKPIHKIVRRLLFSMVAVISSIALSGAAESQTVTDTVFGLPFHNYDRPVNAESYLIRPQEKLIVAFVGTKLSALSLTVNSDGKLVDPSLGIFSLAGLSLAEARELIAPSIRKAYTADDFEITVGGPYRVAITLTGAVAKPGIYLGYSSNYVSELINLAGGLQPTASRRHIEFLGGPRALTVDLDRASSFGDWSADPCLYAGYRVHVPNRSEQTVHIVGAVPSPREIELLPGDSLGMLLEFAGGLTPDADISSISFSGDSVGGRSLSSSLKSGTVVIVPEKSESPGKGGEVAIFGAVRTPGLYPMSGSVTLGGLLARTGGYVALANKSRVTVFRKASGVSRLSSDYERFPIKVGASETADQFGLRTGDSVFVPFTVGFVEVAGRVRFPGLFPFAAGENAGFYIQMAGGFLSDADRQMLDVTDRISRQTQGGGPDSKVGDGDLVTVRVKEITR